VSFCTCDLTISPCKGGHDVETESVDVQIDRISERIEIAEITNKVLAERIRILDAKLSVVESLFSS
jgi:hypothetical protein